MESVLHFFENNPGTAVIISIALNILIAVAGILPSFFITAANITFFGFWPGTLISISGEALGAAVSFLLYRKGFKKSAGKKLEKFPRVLKLINATGSSAFFMIFSLRLIPFIPSGIVTFAAAIGKSGTLLFIAASSLGKIPALLIEAYSVYQVTRNGIEGKLLLFLSALIILFIIYKKSFKNQD